MDNIDKKILKLLQSNAGYSAAEIAQQINLSQSSCWRRVNHLYGKGIIKRNVALLDREKLGMDVVVFIMISLISQAGSALDEFEKQIEALPEVLECFTTTGHMDYILKVVTKDMRHYQAFLRNNLAQLPNIREMHSHVGITQIKDSVALPLDTQL